MAQAGGGHGRKTRRRNSMAPDRYVSAGRAGACDDGQVGADVLTTWGVVLDVEGIVDGQGRLSASDWFAEGRAAFFERCPRLAAVLRTEDA